MLIGTFGAAHSTDNPAALAAFENAVFSVAAHRPVGSSLQSAIEQDPDLVSGHALLGFANVILGRSETAEHARATLPSVEAALLRCGGGTLSERTLVEALRLAVGGHLQAAADRLEAHLVDHPRDFLCLKISQALRFMCGQPAAMLKVTRDILPSWSPADRGYGFVLGCHAFGLEETGLLSAAETVGRDAYRHEAADAWGLHAVSHVMEMTHRTDEGVGWLETSRADWRECNNFAFHLDWHLALFLLEQGRIDEVLAAYDRDIRPTPTDDFRDMANATSLLWRLELEGVDVGDRWQPLAEIALRRRNDVTYVFGSLHYLLALVAQGDHAAADDLVAAFKQIAADPSHDQAKVAADVGVPLAQAIIAMSRGRTSSSDLVHAAMKLPTIGGSHAQRDVFLRTLLTAAATSGDTRAFLGLARIRQNLRSSDRFIVAVEQRLRAGGRISNTTAAARLAS